MINGATQIIAGVPGRHLDPLLLAQSQTKESIGFIMVAYERQPVHDDLQPSKFYDLLFFRGSEIFECARMNQDLRFQLHHEAAFETFRKLGRERGTRVSLFLAPDELLQRFRSTFYYEPCLKVQVSALSKKQIITLLKSTGCQQGIIECNEFTKLDPSLELLEISSPDDIVRYQPSFKHGRILLYDTEKNKELVQERYSVLSKPFVHSSSILVRSHVQKQENPENTSLQIFDGSKQAGIPEPFLDEEKAEEFTEFIKKILDSPPVLNYAAPEGEKADDRSFIITRKDEKKHSAEDNSIKDKPDLSRKVKPNRKPRTKNTSDQSKTDLPAPVGGMPAGESATILAQQQGVTPGDKIEAVQSTAVSTVAESISVPNHQEYIKLFDRLFRSFRQQIFDCYGDKCEAVIANAERKVRFLTPEFDLHALSYETAIVMLDLVETIANDAPFFKKSKLRDAALTLVADLYNKQYELLEHLHVIERVEQFYYRLKK